MECQQLLRVVHHIPGRIRIKFTDELIRQPLVRRLIERPLCWTVIDSELGLQVPFEVDGLPASPSEVPGLKSVRMNWLGRSVIVEYDHRYWPPEWLDELLGTQDSHRLRSMLETMMGKLDRRRWRN
jgi:hypothetical protein